MTIRTDTTGWELKTNRLAVRVAKPGFIYKRTRFDWTGFVTDIVLDNKHSFCSVESANPLAGAGGIGLCNEYGIMEPVGFDSTQTGEPFPKFGIGNLTRLDDKPYFFMKDYPLEAFEHQVTLLADGIQFETLPKDNQGYAAHVIKTLRVTDNNLTIETVFHNVGEKSIHTSEYNHNFVLIDNEAVGSDYTLSFSEPLTFLKETDGSIWFDTKETSWPNGTSGFYGRCLVVPPIPFLTWSLCNKKAGCCISETLNAQPLRVAIWGTASVISPEVFIDLSIEPDCSRTWKRSYQFSSHI